MRNRGLCGTGPPGGVGSVAGRGSPGWPGREVPHNHRQAGRCCSLRHGAWERRSAMPSWTKVRVAGVLAPYAPGFGRELRSCGYTDLSTAEQLRLMSHLSRWMSREGLEALSCEQIAAYCADRKAGGLRGPADAGVSRAAAGVLAGAGCAVGPTARRAAGQREGEAAW